MKVRSYEKKSTIYFLIGFTLLSEGMLLFFFWTRKEYNYINIQGVLVKEDLVLVMVSQKERKKLYQAERIYVHDNLEKYRIVEDRGVLIKRKEDYYELLIELKTGKDKKANDVVSLTLKNKKYRIIEIFKIIWEGG